MIELSSIQVFLMILVALVAIFGITFIFYTLGLIIKYVFKNRNKEQE